jgi:hypothetical protein
VYGLAERSADAGDQISGAAHAEPAGSRLALLDQHVAHERTVDLFGRDPQHVAGEAGRERAHEVLVLGQRRGGTSARDDLVADLGRVREVCVDHIDGRCAGRAVRAIGICDAQRPEWLTEDVVTERDASLKLGVAPR